MFIGNEACESESGRWAHVIDPSTEEVVARVPKASAADVRRACEAARTAFDKGDWPRLEQKERIRLLLELADRLDARSSELMELETKQGGVPIRKTTLMDIPIGLEIFRTIVRLSDFPRYEPLPWVDFPAVSWNFVMREAIGVCAAITAWNFPWLFTMWKSAPALVMGNTFILKPASYTPLTSLVFAEEAAKLLPPGVVNVITGAGGEIGTALCESPHVDKISFTGSTEVGRDVQRQAAGTIKRVTLELGGKSPVLVCDDADLDIAVDTAIFAFLFNSGQACEAGTRLLLDRKMAPEFKARMLERLKLVKIGPTEDFDTTMGPVITASQREVVEGYVRVGLDQGARLLCGGKRPEGKAFDKGFWLEPTVFDGVTADMRIFREEIFGPVLAVTEYDSLEEAIKLANDSIYGLGGAVLSRNLQRAIAIAKQLRTGTVWVNDYHLLNANAPFGGYKQSGVGREMSLYALKEFTEIKHIHVDLVGNDRDRKFWLDYTLNRE
ncbi:MAG: aldehyde dehydrogenase [Deltaproteobacteria bacterium]|nr:aldehyde dehydrogenase [Deltaproteobacteria bacterium]